MFVLTDHSAVSVDFCDVSMTIPLFLLTLKSIPMFLLTFLMFLLTLKTIPLFVLTFSDVSIFCYLY